jgi:hypothetical protein
LAAERVHISRYTTALGQSPLCSAANRRSIDQWGVAVGTDVGMKTEFRTASCHLVLGCSPQNRVLKTEFRKAWCHLLLGCSPWNP